MESKEIPPCFLSSSIVLHIAKAWMQNATDVDVVFQRNDIWDAQEKSKSIPERNDCIRMVHVKGEGRRRRDHGLGFLIPLTAW